MRVTFLGNDEWSVPVLDSLVASGIAEVGVVTNPPRPAGRGGRLTATPVAAAARRLGLDVVEADGVRSGSGWDALRTWEPDLLVVVAFGELLSPAVLELAPLGAVNVHFSLLPRWRGAAPVERAILAGDRVTGVTLMRLDTGLDTGPILARAETPIGPDEDAGSLGARLAELGAHILVETLPTIGDRATVAVAQDASIATTAGKLGPEDRWIPWHDAAAAIDRRVRALAPRPGARTRFRGSDLLILRGRPAPGAGDAGPPGTVVASDADVLVEAGRGRLRLLEVAPAGRAHMPAVDWARGARIVPGERLG